MINLLPLQYKEVLKEEENLKTVWILGILFLAALISFSFILLSIKIYISGEITSQEILLSQKESETLPLEEIEKEIQQQNYILSQLNSFYQKSPNHSEVLEKIFQTLPRKTYLTSLNISLSTTPKAESKMSISLTGFSPDRQTLLEFRKNLETQELFEQVYFPPSNWIKATDIDFSVNFQTSIK